MEEKLICPLHGYYCFKEKCAWYCPDSCSVLSINLSLGSIDGTLDYISQTLEDEIERNKPESLESYRERMKAIEIAKKQRAETKKNNNVT